MVTKCTCRPPCHRTLQQGRTQEFLPGGARLSKIFDGQSKRGREAPERGEGVGGGCPPSHTRELLHF